MVDTVYATYAGHGCVNEVNFTLTLGPSPSTGRVTLLGDVIPKSGNLILRCSQGGLVTLTGMWTIEAVTRTDENGTFTDLTIADRRVFWQWGYIVGVHNQPNAAGEPQQEQTLQALLQLCFDCYNETVVFHDLPIEYPSVRWEFDNPATAAQALCDQYGLSIGLETDGKVHICQQDLERTWPASPMKTKDETESDKILPSKLCVVGSKIINQKTYSLVPVGLEKSDHATRPGAMLPINSLSYKPAEGWGVSISRAFLDVEAGEATELAEQCVYKWYAWMPANFDDLDKELPWLDKLPETTLDDDGNIVQKTPYIFSDDVETDGIACRVRTGLLPCSLDYEIDYQKGIVKFSQPAIKIVSNTLGKPDTVMAATVELTIAHELNTGSESDYYVFEYSIGGDGSERIHKDDKLILYAYDGVIDEDVRSDLDTHALLICEGLEREYQSFVPAVRSYPVILNVSPYGDFKSVTWSVSEQGAETRIASGQEEEKFGMPTYEERLRIRKWASGDMRRWPLDIRNIKHIKRRLGVRD